MCKRICAFFYVLLDMCEAYVRLICAFFTNSLFYVFPSPPGRPPDSPQGACRRPPGSPKEPQDKAHINGICASSPGGPPLGPPVGLLWGPPVGLLWGPPVGTCLAEKEKRYKKVKKCKKHVKKKCKNNVKKCKKLYKKWRKNVKNVKTNNKK